MPRLSGPLGKLLVVAGLVSIVVGVGLWLGTAAAWVAAGAALVVVGEGLDPDGRARR